MSERRAIDPHEAARITKRIGQAFDFAQEVLDNPGILNEIEDGASLAFQDASDTPYEAASTGSRPTQFHSFWQSEQAIEALRFLAELLERAPTDPYLWKWAVFALHDALQGFMGLALRGTHGAQLLVPKHERQAYRRWAEERRLGQPVAESGSRRVDPFLNLYAKIQDPSRMRRFGDSRALSPTHAQDEAIKALDSYRNELMHYGDTTLVLAVGWFPTMVRDLLSVAEWLLEESNTITMFPEERKRAREMIRRAQDRAASLIDVLGSEVATSASS